MNVNSFNLFGVTFINGGYSQSMSFLKKGGLMVVPSGPGLATIGQDIRYIQAVKNADFAIPDSTFMVLILKWFKGIKIKKFSGYAFLSQFFNEKFEPHELFLIDPNNIDSEKNNFYLNSINIPIEKTQHYVAPKYWEGKLEDPMLLEKLNSFNYKPKYIIINLGSNVQEPLGYYLKENLDFKPGIICTGAAISFFTGSQANINQIIDKLGLGWLWRCITKPSVFIPRYLKAFKLFFLVLKSGVKVIE